MSKRQIHLIAGARPNFMKVAPLFHALADTSDFEPILVHTGQHYDAAMSDVFLKEFTLPTPHHFMGVGSGSHAEQTAKVMIAYEKIAVANPPALAVVVGDVNSTLACSITAKKLNLLTAHLEAGLRSRDRTMPEEINRLVTDAISDYLWTPSIDADENLHREGVDPGKIRRVGNIMIDAFEQLRSRIETIAPQADLSLPYWVVTLHRPSNVDHPGRLAALVAQLLILSRSRDVVFPVHPRTLAKLEEFGLSQSLVKNPRIKMVSPKAYTEFLALVRRAEAVLTDSGGIQEETTYLGIPCYTLRENTERPITVTSGTNRLVSPESFNVQDLLTEIRPLRRPAIEYWDGKTSGRIVQHLREIFA